MNENHRLLARMFRRYHAEIRWAGAHDPPPFILKETDSRSHSLVMTYGIKIDVQIQRLNEGGGRTDVGMDESVDGRRSKNFPFLSGSSSPLRPLPKNV